MDISGYEFIENTNGLSRVTKIIDGKTKWGLIDKQGQVLLPVIYDYIGTPLSDNLFSVFNGVFEWEEFDEETEAFFYDLICDRKSWNGDLYEATLGRGFWGLVNDKN